MPVSTLFACLRFPAVGTPGGGEPGRTLGPVPAAYGIFGELSKVLARAAGLMSHPWRVVSSLLRSLSRAKRSGPHVSLARAWSVPLETPRAAHLSALIPRRVLASFPPGPALWAAPTPSPPAQASGAGRPLLLVPSGAQTVHSSRL